MTFVADKEYRSITAAKELWVLNEDRFYDIVDDLDWDAIHENSHPEILAGKYLQENFDSMNMYERAEWSMLSQPHTWWYDEVEWHYNMPKTKDATRRLVSLCYRRPDAE